MAPNTISPPYLLAAGTGSDAGGAWGAYLGLAQDPQVAASVWQANATSNGALAGRRSSTGWAHRGIDLCPDHARSGSSTRALAA